MDRLRRVPSASSSGTADSRSKKKRPTFGTLWKSNTSESRADDHEEPKSATTFRSDRTMSPRFPLPDVFEMPPMLSPDSFIWASQDADFQKLRDNIKKIKKAPSGSEPKNVDAAYDVYKKVKEESAEICKKLLRKSQTNGRDGSLEVDVGFLETRSSNSSSATETGLPFEVNDLWLSTIQEFKAVQESLLETLRVSLLNTYKSYEPDSSEHQTQSFFNDRTFRANLISRMRNTSVHRMRSEGLEFWPRYSIRFRNYDQLKIELRVTEKLFDVADPSTAPAPAPNKAVKEYVIAKNGDTILEFANATSEMHPILRFRVSSHHLAEASPLFSQMLSTTHPHSGAPLDMLSDLPPPPARSIFKEGTEVRLYKMPQIELNKNEALTMLLYAAHMHHRKVPREIEFPVFVSIADVCLRYRCTQPLELQVEYQWLRQWEHRAAADDPDGLLLISYAFGLDRIFTRMSKVAILNAVDDAEVQNKELWPQVLRGKIKAVRTAKLGQIQECCTNAIGEYFRPPQDQNMDRLVNGGSLALTSLPRCPEGSHLCDATNLGWIMMVYNELRILPIIVTSGAFHNLPKTPQRSLKELCDYLRLMPSAPQIHTGVCDHAPSFRSAINDVSSSINGLTLSDVGGKTGWATSKHAGPIEDYYETLSRVEPIELPGSAPYEVPATIIQRKGPVPIPEEVTSRILSHVDNLDDLQSAATINKSFYAAYTRHEVVLLRNVARADRTRRRTMTTTSQTSPVRPDNYPDSPTISPMSAEEAHGILWSHHIPDRNAPPSQAEADANEKYLLGDIQHVENKARFMTNTKHLREEQEKQLSFRRNGSDC